MEDEPKRLTSLDRKLEASKRRAAEERAELERKPTAKPTTILGSADVAMIQRDTLPASTFDENLAKAEPLERAVATIDSVRLADGRVVPARTLADGCDHVIEGYTETTRRKPPLGLRPPFSVPPDVTLLERRDEVLRAIARCVEFGDAEDCPAHWARELRICQDELELGVPGDTQYRYVLMSRAQRIKSYALAMNERDAARPMRPPTLLQMVVPPPNARHVSMATMDLPSMPAGGKLVVRTMPDGSVRLEVMGHAG